MKKKKMAKIVGFSIAAALTAALGFLGFRHLTRKPTEQPVKPRQGIEHVEEKKIKFEELRFGESFSEQEKENIKASLEMSLNLLKEVDPEIEKKLQGKRIRIVFSKGSEEAMKIFPSLKEVLPQSPHESITTQVKTPEFEELLVAFNVENKTREELIALFLHEFGWHVPHNQKYRDERFPRSMEIRQEAEAYEYSEEKIYQIIQKLKKRDREQPSLEIHYLIRALENAARTETQNYLKYKEALKNLDRANAPKRRPRKPNTIKRAQNFDKRKLIQRRSGHRM